AREARHSPRWRRGAAARVGNAGAAATAVSLAGDGDRRRDDPNRDRDDDKRRRRSLGDTPDRDPDERRSHRDGAHGHGRFASLLVVPGYVAATIALTWPIVRDIGRALPTVVGLP